jgi:hypothetical protein
LWRAAFRFRANIDTMTVAPKHPKRPRDFSQAAKLVIDIATGEKPNRDPTPEEEGKDPAAVALGRKGGRTRAAKMTKAARSAAAKKAAKARWST